MTERTIPLDITGPTNLDLMMDAGRICISVADVPAPQLTVRTADASGPSADAVHDTSVITQARHLRVCVPSPQGGSVSFHGGGVTVSGSLSNVSVINGRVFADGREIMPGPAASAVVASVVLPRGSRARLRTRSADTRITGDPVDLDYEGTSGTLNADCLGALDAVLTSGNLAAGVVQGDLDVTLKSGSFSVGAYSGTDARLHMTSGNARMHVLPEATGTLRVSLTSGYARVTGAAHLDVRRRVTSGSLSIT